MTGLTINRLSFNDGKVVDVAPNDIVVFVGPNNMGKSQALRDIFNSISIDHGNIVISELNVSFHNPKEIGRKIEKYSLKVPLGNFFHYEGYHYDILSINIGSFGDQRLVDEQIKNFLVSMVSTEDRLSTSLPKQMVNPGEPKGFPLQYIVEPENCSTLSDIFEMIYFKKIYCEDRGSTMLTLHMGDEIEFNKEGMTPQQISNEYYKRLADLPRVHEQGDGIRSLVGLLLNTMMPNYTLFLMDEPEAFMHPPQARVLGENLPTVLGERQAFISTHSLNLVKGLLSKAANRVKLIKITREGDINHIHCLKATEMDAIWNDPIMRHSNILDGLFYSHTVLCESDSDCQLYATMMSHLKDEQGSYNDVLFTLCNGKGRMKTLSKTLRALGVDYRIIPDIDFFNDEGVTKAVYENCGGNWAEIEDDYRVLYDAMNLPDGTLSHEKFLEEVEKMINKRGWPEMTKPYINKLAKDLPKILKNKWDILKLNGVSSIDDPKVKDAAERLILAMNRVGVFPVKAGELESFFPEVESHGPSFAVSVLEKYPDLSAGVYNNLRDFVASWGI